VRACDGDLGSSTVLGARVKMEVKSSEKHSKRKHIHDGGLSPSFTVLPLLPPSAFAQHGLFSHGVGC